MMKTMTVEKMRDMLETICRKYGYEVFVKALISWDLDIDNAEILNRTYYLFMKNDDISLISEELQNMIYID